MDAVVWDVLQSTGARIRDRRIALALTQVEAAAKAGVAYRTWRRMEADGSASIEDLVRAAIVLRCDEGLAALFPALAATSMDALLAQQRAAATPVRRRVARAGR